MNENVIAGEISSDDRAEAISSEIRSALDKLRKKGYSVAFLESPEGAGELSLTFKLGENRQTIKIANYEWRQDGVVAKRVMENLDI